MEWSFVFFLNSVLLGVGLAMDAFSVSMANGLHDPKMTKSVMVKIAGTFGIFQAAMPMIGWVCVHTIVELFASFETLIPWIALALLSYIGGKMLLDGIRGEEAEEAAELGAGALFMQGVATSIDALSVGFTISEYGWLMALTAAIIIAVVTFILCMAGASAKSSAHSFPARQVFWAVSSSSASVWKSSSPECSEYKKPGASADTPGFLTRLCSPWNNLAYFTFSGSKKSAYSLVSLLPRRRMPPYRWRSTSGSKAARSHRSMAFSRLRWSAITSSSPPVVMVSSIRNRL